jgi:hypothetical protein
MFDQEKSRRSESRGGGGGRQMSGFPVPMVFDSIRCVFNDATFAAVHVVILKWLIGAHCFLGG